MLWKHPNTRPTTWVENNPLFSSFSLRLRTNACICLFTPVCLVGIALHLHLFCIPLWRSASKRANYFFFFLAYLLIQLPSTGFVCICTHSFLWFFFETAHNGTLRRMRFRRRTNHFLCLCLFVLIHPSSILDP